METMSQFGSKEALFEARSLRFARALVDVMDGMKDHDIQAETGLPQNECDMIAEARRDAYSLVYGDAQLISNGQEACRLSRSTAKLERIYKQANGGMDKISTEAIFKAMQLAIDEEREACAKVASDAAENDCDPDAYADAVAAGLAETISERILERSNDMIR